MPSLELALIVKNEETNIPRLLNSMAGVYDKLTIVDTGSTDKTIEIAKSYGANVYHFHWVDDFAAARNFSFSKCTSDYIIWLDADDEIMPDSREILLKTKERLDCADLYLMPYHYAHDEFGTCVCILYRHRIIRRSSEVKWQWPIHECLIYPPSWRQCELPAIVTHRRSGDDYVKDLGRNINMLQKAIKENPTEPRLLFYYAKELFSENRNADCLPIFNKYFEIGGGWIDDQINARLLMALASWKLGLLEDAIDFCIKGIKLDPRWAEFYNTIGQIYYDQEKWDSAIPWFESASRLPMLKVWGTILTDNYTWIPHDRLCKCYSQVGKLKEAYTAAQKALSYRPNDNRLQFNVEFLRDILYPGRKAERPIRLSLGSGGKPTPSYRCTDAFPVPNVEEIIDFHDIPYHNNTVHAIFSEHALEHSDGHIAAEKAIIEWARVLRHGGHLWLKIPDLDLCCQQFLAAEDRDRQPYERWAPKEWYKYTIYGIQTSQNGDQDNAQYHRTGFTKPSIKRLLEQNGFEVQSITNYDGWGTPSIEVHATQTKQPIKVAWMIPGIIDNNHGSLRIRRLNIHNWLCKNGVDSRIINHLSTEEINQAYYADVCIFISFGDHELELISKLKRRGVKCIIDHCEDIHGLPGQNECFESVDLISCCSTLLAINSTKYGRTVMIPDATEELF